MVDTSAQDKRGNQREERITGITEEVEVKGLITLIERKILLNRAWAASELSECSNISKEVSERRGHM